MKRTHRNAKSRRWLYFFLILISLALVASYSTGFSPSSLANNGSKGSTGKASPDNAAGKSLREPGGDEVRSSDPGAAVSFRRFIVR